MSISLPEAQNGESPPVSIQDLSQSLNRSKYVHQSRGHFNGGFDNNNLSISGSFGKNIHSANSRFKHVIEPIPGSAHSRNRSMTNAIVTNTPSAETTFKSPPHKRLSEAKRQQLQQQLHVQQQHQQVIQQQQNNLNYGSTGQQYQMQKFSSLKPDASPLDTRVESLNAYKQISIRGIVSRGREGVFSDEGVDEGNIGTVVEPLSQPDDSDIDGAGKKASGSSRVHRRHDARRRHRQQPSTGLNLAPAIVTSLPASSTLTTALPKLGAGTVGLRLNSTANVSSLCQKSAGLGNNGLLNRGRPLQHYHQAHASPQALPSVRPQPQSLFSNGISSLQQENQLLAHHAQQVQLQSQAAISKDTLEIYHEDHYPNAAVTSLKGLKSGNINWRNQDNFFVVENVDGRPEIGLYCVLDGHGEHGHHVSRRARESFPQHIKACNFDAKRAFYNMQNELCNCEYDVRCSGATCVLAILNGNRLSVSNCGDSRAVLGRRNSNGTISAFPLSTDHKPDQPDERKRILACGGHVGCRHVLVQGDGRTGPVSMPVGPCRVWYQNRGETLGLAMSRSIGDSVVHRCGVSSEPETFEHIVDSTDEFLIIATDGVWDVLDNNLACQIVATAMTTSSVTASTGLGAAAGVISWPLEASNNIAAGNFILYSTNGLHNKTLSLSLLSYAMRNH